MWNDIINLLLGGAIGTIAGCGVVILHHLYLLRKADKDHQMRMEILNDDNL